MVSEFGIPFVYDNHEYWSEYSKILADTSRSTFQNRKSTLPRKIFSRLIRKFLNDYAVRLWKKCETELAVFVRKTFSPTKARILNGQLVHCNSSATMNKYYIYICSIDPI